MVAKNQKQALAKVLVHEGGYVNHPKDPGGATNQGGHPANLRCLSKGQEAAGPLRKADDTGGAG